MPPSEHVGYEVERGRARIILDRPEKRNAVTRRVTTLGWREGIHERDAAFGGGRARVRGPEHRDERGCLVDD